MNIATMSILEHNFSDLTNHDAAVHNSNKTAVLINHSIKESNIFFFHDSKARNISVPND